jgi:hypothetical protein
VQGARRPLTRHSRISLVAAGPAGPLRRGEGCRRSQEGGKKRNGQRAAARRAGSAG